MSAAELKVEIKKIEFNCDIVELEEGNIVRFKDVVSDCEPVEYTLKPNYTQFEIPQDNEDAA